MENYLTWEDVKRFIRGSFKHAVFLEVYLDSIFKSKYMKKDYKKGVQELKKKALESFADIPDPLKQYDGIVSLFQKKDGVHFQLDVNLFIQSVINVYEIKPFSSQRRTAVARLYYGEHIEEYIMEVKKMLKEIKADYNKELNSESIIPINRNNLLEGRHVVNWMIRNLESLVEEYGLEVSEDMLSYFDQEKLLLLIVQGVSASVSLIVENDKKMITPDFAFVQNYCRYIRYRRKENEDFNPKYVVKEGTEAQRQGIIYASDILKYTEQFCASIPEFDLSLFGFQSDEEMLQTCLIDLNEKIENKRREEVRKQKIEEFRKGIELSWEFIPKVGKGFGTLTGISRDKKANKEKQEQQVKREILLEKKLDLFKDLPYVAVLQGTNRLEGYIAFVFANGKVIFEKFYKKTRYGLVPTINEAIYVINIAYFSELSKGEKGDIRSFIKEGIDPDARVINHSSNFRKKVEREVDGIEYNDTILAYIESLVSSIQKEKENVKK